MRDALSREPSVASLPVRETVTLAVGFASRTTVNVEVPPASVVRRSAPSVVPVLAMVTPLVSSSVFLTVVVSFSFPAYPPVLDAVAVSVVVVSPSSMS